MKSDQLSKRWIANFERKSAVQNVSFFRHSLKVEPIVILYCDHERKVQAYCVAEPGMKAYDVTEAHIRDIFQYGKPGKWEARELTAKQFEDAVKAYPKSWYDHPPEEPLGKRVWEPYDEKRGIRNYIDGVYK